MLSMLTEVIQHSVWGILPNKSSGCWCFALWSWFLLSPCACIISLSCTHEFLCKLMLHKKRERSSDYLNNWIIIPYSKVLLGFAEHWGKKGKNEKSETPLIHPVGYNPPAYITFGTKFVNKLYLDEDCSLHLMMLNLEFVKIHWIYHSFNRSVVDWSHH